MQSTKADATSIDCPGQMNQSDCHGWGRLAALLVAGWLLAACAAPAPLRPVEPQATSAPSVQTLAAIATDDPAALVLAERNGAASLDLAGLAALWDADARLVEERGGPGPDNDYTWQGRDAILDRYVVAVFPNPPPALSTAPNLHATIDGDSATLQNGVDYWRFVRRDGRWWITELIIED